MAGLKEVRERIKSVKSTQQITKAMKLVSASKLRKAQDRIVKMRPYSAKLQEVLSNIMANVDASELNLSYNIERPNNRVLIVIVSSDRGLCGGFNSNLIKQAKTLINETYASQVKAGAVTVMPIGKKGYDAFKRNEKLEFNTTYVSLFQNLNVESACKAADEIMNALSGKEFDKVEVVFSEFKNAATQIFQTNQFLPVPKPSKSTSKSNAKSDYLFEPDKTKLLMELVPKILKTSFYRFLLDTNASEHGARMVAMDNATNNADDLIKRLNIEYNKARQAAITNQIMEIVGGAAALEG
ncbi:MAG: ATP synthase F1 subunit gamma [Bacteroidetes bacterium]|nr:ATP synthase F1 subunit gamma [Bacteroidota bacterium]